MFDTTTSSVTYRGGEDQSVFPIPFPFLENSHIRARVRSGTDRRDLQQGVHYAINRMSDGNGELILLHDDLPAGDLLTISREVPLTQEILFHNQGPNSPRAMEEAVDKLTMIAQQLQDGIDARLEAPEGSDAAELADMLVNGVARLDDLSTAVAGLRTDVAGKAAAGHVHGVSAINGLSEQLAGKASALHAHALSGVTGLDAALNAKADAQTVAVALAAKADADDLQGKAAAVHSHAMADVDGLSAALAEQAEPSAHAASHAVGGADALTPAAIGAMSPPPRDGKPYLAAAGGWIEYIAPAGGEGGGTGTGDHAQLLNRDAADQHPQSAIQHLPSDLAALRQSLSDLDVAIQNKADVAQLPGLVSDDAAGLMSPADKAKLAAFDARLNVLDQAVAPIAPLDGRVGTVETSVASLSETVSGLAAGAAALGDMAQKDDAPVDGGLYLRRNGEWVSYVPPETSGGGGGSGGAYIGEIRLMPFRAGELPAGWHFCNGDRLSSGQSGHAALSALPQTFRDDWGVKKVGPMLALPTIDNHLVYSSGVPGIATVDVGGGDAKPCINLIPAIYLGE